MRAKRGVLVGGLLLATVLGVAGGYYAGELTKAPYPTASGVPAPLGGVSGSPSSTPLPIKTPKVNLLKGLNPGNLDFHWVSFTVDLEDAPPLRFSARVPIGWEESITDKGEVKFMDPRHARWIRFAAVYPVKLSPRQKRDQLVPSLKTSIAHEDDFKLVDQSDNVITGKDGEQRKVSALTYTYIPDEWRRPVTVQYIATAGEDGANVEMSITGLEQDTAALAVVAERAAESVVPED